jgi:hypothetical protein
MKDDLDKDIERIKVSRMKPEEKYLYGIFKKLKKYHSETFPDFVYYKENDDIAFIYNEDLKIFWCKHGFWDFLAIEHILNYDECQKIIKNAAYKYLKLKNISPERDMLPNYYWYEPLKLYEKPYKYNINNNI